MKISHLLFWAVFLSVALTSCRKSQLNDNLLTTHDTVDSIDKMIVPPVFNYRTTNETDFQIQLNAPDGNPITGIPVQIGHVVNDTLIPLFTIMTDQNGLAEGFFNLPSAITDIVISPNYIGVLNDVLVPVTGNLVVLNVTGSKVQGPINYSTIIKAGSAPMASMLSRTLLHYQYLSPYNSSGVPSVMATRDVITAQQLQFINNSLPEQQNVAVHHPGYLQQNLNTDLDITTLADVWLTFVHEGAGYTNSLGFYKYQTNNPPTSMSQIDTVYLAFPNASYSGSGGALHSGDRVKIGTFPAGTSIGFVCISNGWNGSGVGNGNFILFSDQNLNVQSNPALKQQSVLLYDNVNQIYYLGFEDIARNNPSCDNDFNDIVFYAKSNPVSAISNVNMPLIDNGIDSDGDGVSDLYDSFPNDATLAYKNFYPSATTFNTLAFEDSWPGKGDYDFNDLVVGYQYEEWANAQNKVKSMKARFAIRAIGAHYKHGFGFQMNVPSSAISNVTGSMLYDNSVTLSANHTEANQNKATVIAFDNDYRTLNIAQGAGFNTLLSKMFLTPDTVTLGITFSSPKSLSELGAAPFNPFIFIDGNRGKEVHLPGYAPTQLANTSLFGTSHDNTNVSNNTFYKTKNNLPYALMIPADFTYPVEQSPINQGYLKFIEWAQSGGQSYPDWYTNHPGYRNNTALYMH